MISRAWCWCAASCLLLAAAGALPAGGATVETRHVGLTVAPDGSFRETTRLVVRLDTVEDVQEWATYPIFVDENRTLERVSGGAVHPDGSRDSIKRKHRERVPVTSDISLHTSQEAEVILVPRLFPGSVLRLEYEVLVRPYFPATVLGLVQKDAVADLRVDLRGASGWRWHVEGDEAGIEVVEPPEGGLRLTARDLPRAAEYGRGERGRPPVVHLAWGDPRTWQDVGRWYEEILGPLPRAQEAVRRKARELTAGLETPRQRLEALLGFLTQDVRYVSIAMGIGGYRPSPPHEVLERRWGDCKDKSLLLIDLLREAGIEAHPVLILSSLTDQIETAFPSPFHFNHLIVAVPVAERLEVDTESDPVADGLLFLDPTQPRAGARWLNPLVQNQEALVVRGAASGLVRTPGRAADESLLLEGRLTAGESGGLEGQVNLMMTGIRASAVKAALSTPRAEETFRGVLGQLLPGAVLEDLRWGFDEAEVPTLRLAARVRLDHLVQGAPERPSVQLPGPWGAPEPRNLREVVEPLAVQPGVSTVVWHLELPESWCLPPAADEETANDAGRVTQSLQADGRTLVLNRRTDVLLPQAEGETLEQLRALAAAEYRAGRQRLRFGCGER